MSSLRVVTPREVAEYAQGIVNTEPAIQIARNVARDCGLNPERFNRLRAHLAQAYAQGYLQGYLDGKAHKMVEVAPPPQVIEN